MKNKVNGYVIHETSRIVVVATGFKTKTENIKTGNMIQTWIILKAMNPVDGVKSGADKLICGGCTLRRNDADQRSCYVNVGQAPLAIYRAWQRGQYPTLTNYDVFNNLAVRFGSYGNPTLIPLPIIREIASRSSNWTGYTHEWMHALKQGYKSYLMASADNAILAAQAQGLGWRTFRVTNNTAERISSEIVCVNETHNVQCEKCSMCNGSTKKTKSIVITVHGTGKGNFNE